MLCATDQLIFKPTVIFCDTQLVFIFLKDLLGSSIQPRLLKRIDYINLQMYFHFI